MRKRMTGLALALLLVLGLPQAVLAAIERATGSPAAPQSHGAEEVFCKDAPPATLDFYHAQLPTFGAARTVVNIDRMTRDEVYKLMRDRLKGIAFRDQFDYAVKALGPIEDWISTPLKDTVAANEPYALRPGCAKYTLAARQGSTMFIDPMLAAQSTDGQLGLLSVTAPMSYFLEKHAGGEAQGNAKVRALSRALLSTIPDEKTVRQAVLDLGGALTYYDVYRGATYVSQSDGRRVVFTEAGNDHVSIGSKVGAETRRIDTFACQNEGKLCWTGLETQTLLSPIDGGERIVIYRAGSQSADPDAPNAGEVYRRVR